MNTMSRIGNFLVAVFNTNKYHRIWIGYFSVGVSIRYIPCLEQDIFGSVNRSLRFHPHTSAGKVLAPFFSDGQCIGFFSTLHYIISHQMALLWSTYIKLLYITYITLQNITLYHITLQNIQNSFLLKAISHYISVLNSDKPCISFFSSLHNTLILSFLMVINSDTLIVFQFWIFNLCPG